MVISETRKRAPTKGVEIWRAATPAVDMYVSAISFGELAAGAYKVHAIDGAFHDSLRRWIGQTRELFRERTLPVMTEVAERWGELYSRLGRHDMDLLIAATALVRDLTLVTCNVRHFAPAVVRLFNPCVA